MKYISTRGKAPVLNFEEAMLTGLQETEVFTFLNQFQAFRQMI